MGTNRWQAQISKDWFFRVAPNGGYMMSIVARAMGKAFSRGEYNHCDPISATATFINPADAGGAEIEVITHRQGRRFSQGIATLTQNGKPCVQLMATYGNIGSMDGATCNEFSAPAMPPPEDCELLPADIISFREQVETRLVPDDFQFFHGGGKGRMEHYGWLRFADHRPADLLALLTFADALPRAVGMRTGVMGWLPTLDLTVQCLAKPAPGYIVTKFSSRMLANGVLEEQGEMWDSTGKLVAVCRQSATIRVPEDKLALLR
ncbi:thioesterase family protein [Endozoicomonas sp. GU-1]|uniref:thioesterase family protein n=1 Tax=Endozoicomonas sp. GU-1 TaxID=3009078 RepID=UPI0022B4072F|nr:thioesterase family protein [Endozoicomonas sp. GU-1]WBA80307.1 thioesterase family protein [Endozoicomonas sp. GU-1]WBA87878.1 thioesterase family protein [Endozoicomonas sp. GU-1]